MEAYEVLFDDEKRQRYDQYGHAGVDGMGHAGGGFSSMDDIFPPLATSLVAAAVVVAQVAPSLRLRGAGWQSRPSQGASLKLGLKLISRSLLRLRKDDRSQPE